MDIQKLVTDELYLIRELFNKQMRLLAYLVLIKEEQRFLVPVSFKDDEHKDVVGQGMRDLVREVMPDVVIFTSEVWISKLDMKAYKEGRMIREANDRQEAVQVLFEFKTGERFLKCAHIMRTGELARLARFEDWDYKTLTGRFVDFFPPTNLH